MLDMVSRPTYRIRDLYREAIREIMAENDIEPLTGPSHIVSANASFREVVQHTHWYVDRGDSRPHYRFRRYYEILNHVGTAGRREAHVDVGCGAGLFSWAFLDWARIQNIGYDRVDLYGWDHCQTMIDLAEMTRTKLLENIHDYPHLHYSIDLDGFLQQITKNHQGITDYTITFGHVLVQAGSPDDLRNFTQIITHIINLMDNESNCVLWAADARGQSNTFTANWESLLNNLRPTGILYEVQDVPISEINNSNDAKFAVIIRAT